MIFNSQTFLIFFAVVYLLYLLAYRRTRTQNILLLAASYIFYGYWDWRFLILILISTIADFTIGREMGRTADDTPAGLRKRKRLLALSVAINLGILGFFKYFNFFAESLANLTSALGFNVDPVLLEIILPVGISFYTFQTMSYTIDIFRKRLQPTDSLLNFAVFVAFFPQLVAGPIERAVHFLPQIENPRHIRAEQIGNGFFLIVWGYFKKVFVADNAARIANEIFNNYQDFSGLDLIIGVVAFAIQIYGDFSGYSDIARGIARLMGFELIINFKLPYFAISPSDFWRRWHISLSTWLRDYLYIPLGGNRKGTGRTNLNLFITMLLGGLWHGAAWNFVIWGAYHGVILIIYRALGARLAPRKVTAPVMAYAVIAAQMTIMFALTLLGWLIFRSSSVEQITYFLGNASLRPSVTSAAFISSLLSFTILMLMVEIYQQVKRDLLIVPKMPPLVQASIYGVIVILILILGVRESIEFIYFQF
jgi:D-alanyl-lipoteichoic acid acyltransferase DltB (MBOAT superfamily)